MARWEETIDYQLDLWKWSRTPTGISYHEGWAKSVLSAKAEHELSVVKSGILEHLSEAVEVSIFNADPIYVDPDMMTIAESAMDSFAPEPLQPTDLITPDGFMVLPRAIRFPDVRYKEVANRALLWYSYTFKGHNAIDRTQTIDVPGIIFMMFSHVDDKDDYWDEAAYLALRKHRLGSNKLVLNHVEPWAFGTSHKVTDIRAIDKYVQVFWRLLVQTITVKSEARPSREYRKRAQKEKFPDKNITVVTLRRPKGESTGERNSVEWTHRWLVGGHWRNQWFPSLSQHRQIWISPYIKGPEDKPLEVRKLRVFELVR